MARNYSLVANTVFRNRSFDDLLKPLAMYTENYNTVENALSDLETKANIWEGMANEEQDPVAYAQYKKYADDVREQAKLLASTGLNDATNRRGLLDLRRRYSAEIVPIEQAYAARKAQFDEQRKALLANPTLLLSRRADRTSLDDYMTNPQLGYESYSGALLAQQVGQQAAAIAKSLTGYANGQKLDKYTKTWLEQHGLTASQVAQAVNNPNSPGASSVLNSIVNEVMGSSGIANWADRGTLEQAYQYARQGLWNAVGDTKIHTYADRDAIMRAAGIGGAKGGNKAPLKFTPMPLRSQRELTDTGEKIQLFINQGFVEQKGDRWVLTEKGKKEALNNHYSALSPAQKAELMRDWRAQIANPLVPEKAKAPYRVQLKDLEEGRGGTSNSPFREFLLSLNGGHEIKDSNGKFMPTRAGQLFGLAKEHNKKGMYDMNHTTQFYNGLDKSTGEEYARLLKTAPSGTFTRQDSWNGKEWEGEELKPEDLNGFTVLGKGVDPQGPYVQWGKLDTKGDIKKTIRTNLPKLFNEGAVNDASTNYQALMAAYKIFETGKRPITNPKDGKILLRNGEIMFSDEPLSPMEALKVLKDARDAYSNMEGAMDSYYIPSTVDKTKVTSSENFFGNLFEE